MVAVAELVIRLTPGPVAEGAISVLGKHDKPFLVLVRAAAHRAPSSRTPAGWRARVLVGAGDRVRRRWPCSAASRSMQQRGAGAVDLLPVARRAS